jgi:hypothetical protein
MDSESPLDRGAFLLYIYINHYWRFNYMTTLTIQIDDSLVKEAGEDTLQDYLKEQLDVYKLRILGGKLKKAVQKSGIDLEKELDKAKEKAWRTYKEENLKEFFK